MDSETVVVEQQNKTEDREKNGNVFGRFWSLIIRDIKENVFIEMKVTRGCKKEG